MAKCNNPACRRNEPTWKGPRICPDCGWIMEGSVGSPKPKKKKEEPVIIVGSEEEST